jgi:hypothetical protein
VVARHTVGGLTGIKIGYARVSTGGQKLDRRRRMTGPGGLKVGHAELAVLAVVRTGIAAGSFSRC